MSVEEQAIFFDQMKSVKTAEIGKIELKNAKHFWWCRNPSKKKGPIIKLEFTRLYKATTTKQYLNRNIHPKIQVSQERGICQYQEGRICIYYCHNTRAARAKFCKITKITIYNNHIQSNILYNKLYTKLT